MISATTDNPNAEKAFGDHDWNQELPRQSDLSYYLIAELVTHRGVRPIGAMQVCDPHLEPEHYWGEIEPDLRAIDIWIGNANDLGKGYGQTMMRLAIELCFADPNVKAIVIDPLASNTRSHRFYQRLGFKPIGRRNFGDDDCLVHRLDRS